MRIFLHDYGRYPYTIQLARSLASRGHEVLYLFRASELPRARTIREQADPLNFMSKGVQISQTYYKYSFFKRWFQERMYGKSLSMEIEDFHPDLVISANTPLLVQVSVIKLCKKKRIQFLFWIQDLQGIAVHDLIKKRIPVLGFWIGQYFLWLEHNQIKNSDQIVLITEDFKRYINKWVSNSDEVYVIPNWAPIEEIALQPKDNQWAKQYGLTDKICILYAGILGMKHSPALFVDLALQFIENDSVRIVIVANDGPVFNFLKEKKIELDLKNLIMIEFQPFELIPQILGSSDILVGVLEPEASKFSVPSKVQTYLCGGKPILYSMPLDNLATRIISQSGSGFVYPPHDRSGFLEAAFILVNDKKKRESLGKNARQYAETHFDIEIITEQFEKIIGHLKK